MKISALIPYKADFGVRDRLWEKVRNRYQTCFPEVEICIGKDDGEPFSRALAINRAAKQASGEIFMIVDTDVFFNPDLIAKIRSSIYIHPWIVPWSNAYRLAPEATERLMAGGIPETVYLEPEDIELTETAAGAFVNVMTRDCFEAVSGMDESFRGWGCEDTAFSLALDTICGRHLRLDAEVFHLWHPPASTAWYQNNFALFEPYLKANGDPERMKQLIRERKQGRW